jgi:hypothetical protein
LTAVPAIPNVGAGATDDLDRLALAGRADWRFLLPDPELGRVTYLAPHDPELVAALELSASALDLYGAPAASGGHEVVVITGRSPTAVAIARALLDTGGWLYAEVPGARARAWERELRRNGFAEIAAYWLWPSARSFREIVPLESSALQHALGRRDPGARLRIRARAAELLVRTGLFRLVVRRAAVIGQWSP